MFFLLNHIFEYWNERNKNNIYSKKLNKNIKKRISQIKLNPKIGKATEINNIRTISLGHYSIFYKIIDLNIYIIGFWDNRRDFKKLLNFLKNN